MTKKRFKITDYPTDIEDTQTGEKYPCSSYGTHMETICDLLNDLNEENEQLKTTISRLIEQNRKNNDLLVSDIRLLEKALWCPNCTINIKRLRELKKEFEK